MNEPRKDGTRAVPFRRLVRTSTPGAAEQPVAQREDAPEQGSEYEYGCVEWYQYPGEAPWNARKTEPRRRVARN